MSSEASGSASASNGSPEGEAMGRALDLALRGWGRVAPNPLVGAVVLRGDAPVGAGFHAEYGGPHAEVVALADAGDRARGATLVVTLEPCAHYGKTPPCTDAIVAAGVARVVAAVRDPDPQARGGAEVLRGKGVAVSFGVLAEAAAALNAPFLFAHTLAERPFVALKLATSIDGRIADAHGSSRWVWVKPRASTCTGCARDSTPSPWAGRRPCGTTRSSRCAVRSRRGGRPCASSSTGARC